MKKIRFEKKFIEHFNVRIDKKENGDIEVLVDCDFMVYLNEFETMAAASFMKNKKGSPMDTTLPLKDLLVDQLQYVDYIQKAPRGKKEISVIDLKFKDKKGTTHS